MPSPRLTNPALAEIEEHLAQPLSEQPSARRIVQFDRRAAYDGAMLARLDTLCERHGERLEVRFYSHEPGEGFDASVLQHLPQVRSLTLDCLRQTHGLQAALGNLAHLEAFALQVEHGDFPGLLALPNLARLRTLRVSQDRGPVLDLAPLAGLGQLHTLALSAQSHHLQALAGHPGLERLYLHRQPHGTPLDVANHLPALVFLSVSFGSREAMPELRHQGLRELEIIRVRGLKDLQLEHFPGLRALWVEDQAQLGRLDLEGAPELHGLLLSTCKSLAQLHGLAASRLADLRLRTVPALDLLALVENQLPASLCTLEAWTGKRKLDIQLQEIQQRKNLPRPGQPFWPV
ncbi:hypothetical protein SAMN05216588_109113 [Pseudomonas flavescens]|uniref:Leucine-rich repeat domain-containing protein n=1 Tax=Phytopseudomonas flavescens TaxID=29435 RepID=A0A1G8GME8_9GAMM|nr:hypothetical protein [Pseudomonas flavescens]SDH95542.1 hypothetical protein SAMN05216588_109113 [Pseudomonas flavescens]